jgi:hypothetical protein
MMFKYLFLIKFSSIFCVSLYFVQMWKLQTTLFPCSITEGPRLDSHRTLNWRCGFLTQISWGNHVAQVWAMNSSGLIILWPYHINKTKVRKVLFLQNNFQLSVCTYVFFFLRYALWSIGFFQNKISSFLFDLIGILTVLFSNPQVVKANVHWGDPVLSKLYKYTITIPYYIQRYRLKHSRGNGHAFSK